MSLWARWFLLPLTNLLVCVVRLHGGYLFLTSMRRVTFSRGCPETLAIMLSQGERRRSYPTAVKRTARFRPENLWKA